VKQCETGLHRAPPELWPRLGGDEDRGSTSAAVSAGVAGAAAVAVSAGAADSAAVFAASADSAAVETVMAPPVPGVFFIIFRFRSDFALKPTNNLILLDRGRSYHSGDPDQVVPVVLYTVFLYIIQLL
jgi:hypothetical protein